MCGPGVQGQAHAHSDDDDVSAFVLQLLAGHSQRLHIQGDTNRWPPNTMTFGHPYYHELVLPRRVRGKLLFYLPTTVQPPHRMHQRCLSSLLSPAFSAWQLLRCFLNPTVEKTIETHQKEVLNGTRTIPPTDSAPVTRCGPYRPEVGHKATSSIGGSTPAL